MPHKDPLKKAECKRQWKKNHPESDKAYYIANKPKIQARQSAWRKANPEHTIAKRREQTLRRYGLTITSYNEMLMGQESCCALCGHSPDEFLVVDHCHATGKVRSLLCTHCNAALGMLRDNPTLIRKAADYIENN